LIDRGGDTPVGLGQLIDRGDGFAAGERDGDLALVAVGRRLAADRARFVESGQRLVEFPTLSRPREPFAPGGDEAKIVCMSLGETQR